MLSTSDELLSEFSQAVSSNQVMDETDFWRINNDSPAQITSGTGMQIRGV
jgi:hypothetical protein